MAGSCRRAGAHRRAAYRTLAGYLSRGALLAASAPLSIACSTADPARDIRSDQVARAAEQPTPPRPHPDLSPSDVVRIQLGALQHNDPASDSGLAIVFEFASPANRMVVGPLERFVELINGPEYRPLLNHRRAVQGPVVVSGNLAEQRVLITGAAGTETVYVFILARQLHGRYRGCWMTEGVLREQMEPEVPLEVREV